MEAPEMEAAAVEVATASASAALTRASEPTELSS